MTLDQLYPDLFAGFLKPKILEGRLTVAYVDDQNGSTSAPVRTLPIVVSLSRSSAVARLYFSPFICFLLLTLGGVSSLVLNHGIPNGFRRLAIRGQLDVLGRLTKQLSAHVSGALRVELRVHRAQLSWRLDKEWSIFPTASECYDEVGKDTAALGSRIVLVSAIDERLMRIERMGSLGPPDLLRTQKRRLAYALRILSDTTPAESALGSVDKLLIEVDAELARIEQEDNGLRDEGQKKLRDFWADTFEPAWKGVPKDVHWATALTTSMGGFVEHAQRCFEEKRVASETVATLDTAYTKLKLILEYIRICENATPEKSKLFDEKGLIDEQNASLDKIRQPGEKELASKCEPPTQRKRFFEGMSGTGARTLEEARVLLREAEQGIFVKQVIEQVVLHKFNLRVEPRSPAQYDLIRFRFEFYEDKFNDAVARDKLDCLWKFKEQDEERSEDCWDPVQFFATEGPKLIDVQVRNGSKVYVPCGNEGQHLQLNVLPAHDRSTTRRVLLEGFQLGIALTVTLGALVAGARDQLQKLDPTTAVTAIIALGFGADTLKNLVSRRPPSSSPPPRVTT